MVQISRQGLVFHLGRFSQTPVSAGFDNSLTAASPYHQTVPRSAQTQCLRLQHLFGQLVKREHALGGKYSVL